MVWPSLVTGQGINVDPPPHACVREVIRRVNFSKISRAIAAITPGEAPKQNASPMRDRASLAAAFGGGPFLRSHRSLGTEFCAAFTELHAQTMHDPSQGRPDASSTGNWGFGQ